MSPIAPVPATRVTDQLVQRRLLSQVQFDQRELFRIQTQISTGRRVALPSEDAPAALRATQLQQLIERKDQVRINLSTGQSFMSASDLALKDVADILADVRGRGLSVLDTISDDGARRAVAAQVDEAIKELIRIGNQQFRGRFLFAGSQTDVQPFEVVDSFVNYVGNENQLQSFSDLDQLFETNVHGNTVFGAISDPVRGTADLGPVLTPDTLLSDLWRGLGISQGSIAISDGTNTSIVDLSDAVTIGDVAARMELNPPPSRTLTVIVTPAGLRVELDAAGGGNLTVTEVGGGTTAHELGIFEPSGVLTGPLAGEDLNPRLRPTTLLRDILGARASARIVSPGANNDLILTAAAAGPQWNNVAIQFVDDALLEAAPGLTAGNETAEFDAAARAARRLASLAGLDNDLVITAVAAGTGYNNVSIELVNAGDVKQNPTATYTDVAGVRTLTLGIDDSDETLLADLVAAIESTGLFTVSADGSAGEGFNGAAAVRTANAGVVKGNTGNSGGNAGTLYVNVRPGVTSANNVALAINAEGTFIAEIDARDSISPLQQGRGPIDLDATATTSGGSGAALDKDSGIRVTNGGETYEVSFSAAETIEDLLNILNGSGAGLLAEINHDGTGIDVRSRLSGSDFSIGENGGTTATQLGLRTFTADTRLSTLNKGLGVDTAAGTDFIVRRNDGITLEVDVSAAETVADIIDLINQHPDNQDGAPVVARLAEYGNGIELVDDNPSGVDAGGQPNTLQVLRVAASSAAVHLGLVPAGEDVGGLTSPATFPTAVAWLTGPNTDLTLTGSGPGTGLGGTRVELVNNAAVGDQALVSYDAASGTLQIDVDPAATRAATVVAAVNAEGTLQAQLNTQAGPNDGSGLIVDTGEVAVLSAGSPETLTGTDVRPLEAEGAFNTLLRLHAALIDNDLPEMRRTLEMLEDDIARVTFSRAEIGARQQGLDTVTNRLIDEDVELKRALSTEIDVDLAEAITELTARQFAFEAALQASARTVQLTLLDYL